MQNQSTEIRHDWQLTEILQLFSLPFNELIFIAQTLHRCYFNPNEIQLSSLLNIKTGQCSEDCAYCSQSAHFKTALESEPLMPTDAIIAAAKQAKAKGATRFCMGAAWRSPKTKDFTQLLEVIVAIKQLELETCMTLGMLNTTQAQQLKAAGLDYYNHNLDTSSDYYKNIVTTHTYQERLDTLAEVQKANIKLCCGGIIGMGERVADRADLLRHLANLPKHPESVPINLLIPIAGTPLENSQAVDSFDLVRCIAVARILMPTSYVRLSAGRSEMADTLQALCFLAGANSIFYGDKLLTTDNAEITHDKQLLDRLGLNRAFS